MISSCYTWTTAEEGQLVVKCACKGLGLARRQKDKEPLIHHKRRGMTSLTICCIVQIILVLYYITLYYFIFPDDSDLLINTVQYDGMRITRTTVSLDI